MWPMSGQGFVVTYCFWCVTLTMWLYFSKTRIIRMHRLLT